LTTSSGAGTALLGTYPDAGNGDRYVRLRSTRPSTSSQSEYQIRPDSVFMSAQDGDFRVRYMAPVDDTVAYKPTVWDAVSRKWRVLRYWPSTGGSTSAYDPIAPGTVLGNAGSTNALPDFVKTPVIVYERTVTNKDTIRIRISDWSSSYNYFEVHFDLKPSQDEAFVITMSGNGSFSSANHAYSNMNTKDANSSGIQDGNFAAFDVGGEAGEYVEGVLYLYDPGNSSKKQKVRYSMAATEKTTGKGMEWSGVISKTTTGATTDVELKMFAGNFSSGRIWIQAKSF
jgi:hypothetical protein